MVDFPTFKLKWFPEPAWTGTLEAELEISQRVLFSLKGLEQMEAVLNDCRHLSKVYPRPFDYRADRRVIAVELLAHHDSFDQRICSVCDFKGEEYLGGMHCSAAKLLAERS